MESKVYRVLLARHYFYGVPVFTALTLAIVSLLIGAATERIILWMVIIYPLTHLSIFLALDENKNFFNNAFALMRCWFRNRKNKEMDGVYYSPIDFN